MLQPKESPSSAEQSKVYAQSAFLSLMLLSLMIAAERQYRLKLAAKEAAINDSRLIALDEHARITEEDRASHHLEVLHSLLSMLITPAMHNSHDIEPDSEREEAKVALLPEEEAEPVVLEEVELDGLVEAQAEILALRNKDKIKKIELHENSLVDFLTYDDLKDGLYLLINSMGVARPYNAVSMQNFLTSGQGPISQEAISLENNVVGPLTLEQFKQLQVQQNTTQELMGTFSLSSFPAAFPEVSKLPTPSAPPASFTTTPTPGSSKPRLEETELEIVKPKPVAKQQAPEFVSQFALITGESMSNMLQQQIIIASLLAQGAQAEQLRQSGMKVGTIEDQSQFYATAKA